MSPNRLDIIMAELFWGGKCGHVALAAVLGIPMREARRLMPETEDGLITKRWKTALDRADRKWRDIGENCPTPGSYGLVWLDFGKKSHAIAAWNDGYKIMAFDNNSARWMRLYRWETIILPMLKIMARSTKCWIYSVIEVQPKSPYVSCETTYGSIG